jgi:hypothetical protein
MSQTSARMPASADLPASAPQPWSAWLARLAADRAGWLAAGLIAIGALLRLGLILAGWPATDSDEATMGLMALHINAGLEHPLFFDGQSYMGTIQAYLGALLFRLFGASVVSLRLALLLLFILYLVVMWSLLKLLYGPRFALVGLLLLDLGGPDLLKPQLLALGGYPETLLFAALAVLLALRLARPHPPAPSPAGEGEPESALGKQLAGHARHLCSGFPLPRRGGGQGERFRLPRAATLRLGSPSPRRERGTGGQAPRRLALYAALGLTMGVAWWSDQLVFPYLVAAMALLAFFCRRELLHGPRWRPLGALLAGLVVGVSPQLIFLTQPHPEGPSAIAAFEWQGPSTILRFFTQFGAHLFGELLVALPNITGMGWVCVAPTLPNGALAMPATGGAALCLGLRALWSAGLLALGLVAALLSWQALRRSGPLRAAAGWQGERRAAAVRHGGRLALLLGGALTLALYLVSLAASTPAGNARYLIEMNIALPAMLYPLWALGVGAGEGVARPAWLAAALAPHSRGWRWLALGLVAALLAGGVVATYRLSAATRASAQADQRLIHDLERLGVRHMHTDYWTCDKVAFLSQERITCDTLKSELSEGFNRYPPYVAQVAADPHATYVMPSQLPQAAALRQRAQNPDWHYTLTVVDGYDVWLPGASARHAEGRADAERAIVMYQ